MDTAILSLGSIPEYRIYPQGTLSVTSKDQDRQKIKIEKCFLGREGFSMAYTR
jgi:hypothetical protein